MGFLKTLLLIFFLSKAVAMQAQRIALFEVTVPKTQAGLDVPVKVCLDSISFLPDTALQLVSIRGQQTTAVPFQIENGEARWLHWIIPSGAGTGKKTFALLKGAASLPSSIIETTDQDGAYTISTNGQNLLRYHHQTVYPPQGIDTAYKRSGFIHPLWAPHGQALTRINAPDHYHHWGLWNPWTRVLFEQDTVDFWNLKDRQGTVRFAGLLATVNGPVFSGFAVRHEHVVLKKEGGEKVALNEVQQVRIYHPPSGAGYYILDITSQLACATASPVKLLEYRYGGLGIRATKAWNKDNSEVLTSEGKARKAADGSTARWCLVQGDIQGDTAGLAMLSYPANYNHPEPLRVWPEDANQRGDVFLNFSPTKNKDWLLLPGKTYMLRYRFVVFNGRFNKETAEAAWQSFAYPPTIIIKK